MARPVLKDPNDEGGDPSRFSLRDYRPVARAMAATLPHVDCFAAAHSLDALAAIEGELARL